MRISPSGPVALATMLALGLAGHPAAQAPANPSGAAPRARIKIDVDRTIGTVDPLLFGNFSEHLGRMI